MQMHTRNKKEELKVAKRIADDVMKEWEEQGRGWATGAEIAEEVCRRAPYYNVYYREISAYAATHPRTL